MSNVKCADKTSMSQQKGVMQSNWDHAVDYKTTASWEYRGSLRKMSYEFKGFR